MSQNPTSTNDPKNLDDDIFNESADLTNLLDDSQDDLDLDEFSDNTLDSDILIDLEQPATSTELDDLFGDEVNSGSLSSTIESGFVSEEEANSLIDNELETQQNSEPETPQKKSLKVSIRSTKAPLSVSEKIEEERSSDENDFVSKGEPTVEVSSTESSSNDEPQEAEDFFSSEPDLDHFTDTDPFAEESDQSASTADADPFADDTTDAFADTDADPFEEESDQGVSNADVDPFADDTTDTFADTDVDPFADDTTDAFADTDTDPFAEESDQSASVDDVNPFDDDTTDAFADADADPFAEQNTTVDYKEWSTTTGIKESENPSIQPPSPTEQKEQKHEPIKMKENDTMSKANDSQLLSQVNDEISAKPRKSGVGIISNVLLSGLISAGSILAYQEFFVPKDVITEGDMQEALAKATRDISDRMQEQEMLITSQIIEELKAKGVIGNASEVSLPEVAQIANDAKQIAELANSQAGENVKMISENKEKHQELALLFGETSNDLQGSEARFKKALKALFEIRRKTESENRDLRHELEKQVKENKARANENKKLAKEVEELKTRQTQIRGEIKNVRVVTEELKKEKPRQSNKVQEALGLTSTGINVVKGEPLPEVEVKGVIGNKILIVNPKTSMIDTYKVGDNLEGYGKIIEIIAQNKTALTDKGLLNKK